jgi:hypothetical protein
MTPHDHRQFVPGCFRCELGRDEALAALPEPLGHCVEHGEYWTDDCYRCYPPALTSKEAQDA